MAKRITPGTSVGGIYCLPPAATIYVIASQYQTYVLRASSAILLGTAVSVLTVTAMLYLITHDLLPIR